MVTEKKYYNTDCDKAHCPETDSYLAYELAKLYPGLKAELDNWYNENGGSRICEKHWKELKANKKQREQEKQKAKENQFKLSHCHVCGKESLVYHYIFDKRTNKFEESLSNATDSDNQIVFCTKEHFKGWLKQILTNQEKARQEAVDLLNEQRKDLEEELQKLEEKNNRPCDHCSKKLGDSQTVYYNSATNDGKKLCSDECYSTFYGEDCDKCNKRIKTTEKSYYADGKNIVIMHR